jgi:SNF2 family DNA or RNA helicase
MNTALDQAITAKLSPNDRNILAKIKLLNKDEKRILSVISVVYEHLNQTSIQQILNALSWRDANGDALSKLMAKDLRERLTEDGLLFTTTYGLRCPNIVAETLSRELAQSKKYADITNATDQAVPKTLDFSSNLHLKHDRHGQMAIRHLRDYVYLPDRITATLPSNPAGYSHRVYHRQMLNICFQNFNKAWFETLDYTLRCEILLSGLELSDNTPDHTITIAYLEHCQQSGTLDHPGLKAGLAEHYLMQGHIDKIDNLIPSESTWQSDKLRGLEHALKSDYASALPFFDSSFDALKKETKLRNTLLPGLSGLCHVIALLQSNREEHKTRLVTLCKVGSKKGQENALEECYEIIQALNKVLGGEGSIEDFRCLSPDYFLISPHAALLRGYAWYWTANTPSSDQLEVICKHLEETTESANSWYVSQALIFLEYYNYKGVNHPKIVALKNVSEKCNNSLLDLLQIQAPWELALNALQELSPTDSEESNDEEKTRLIWVIESKFGNDSLKPKEQKLSAKGEWSKGKNISLKRLHKSPEEFDYLSDIDKAISQCIYAGFGPFGNTEYELSLEGALSAAVDHPNIYWESRLDTPVDINRVEPELLIHDNTSSLNISLNPFPKNTDSRKQMFRESDSRLRIVEYKEEHFKIASILSEAGLDVPANAKEQVLKSINAIAPLLSVQSDIGGGSIEAKTLPPSPHLFMQIESQNSSMRFELTARPLGEDGPRLEPGLGRKNIMADIDGERCQCQRDLDHELINIRSLFEGCPSLNDEGLDDEPYIWLFDEEASLEVLFDLQGFISRENETQLEVLWPKGGQVKLRGEASLANMKASVRKAGDWFKLDGELNLSEGDVLSMSNLMGLIENSSSRFVKLDDNTFITLTAQLQKRLKALQQFGKEQEYHPLALSALDELTEGMDFDGDSPWEVQKVKLLEAYKLEPELPRTLQAELRDYQFEGFQWLYRLAHWGAGACLADDMGLGKTLQSLAIILARASKGPSLVLAPTSVCMNWISEAARFAPSLKVHRFGEKDRQTLLDSAGPFDLIVCSYGLLQNEHERIQAVEWQTLVADEAQALKNSQAKRTKAAISLNANFRIATTGTPIENHLGELWTLFRFINPGLLGSLDQFNKRFANPIQNQQDANARIQLKRLVQPFILRRLKTEVLPELPARTEITHFVTLSKEEKVFYESLRRKALENLTTIQGNEGQKQLRVLAEIMRLRRACCNPELVAPGVGIASSKLEAFATILEELIENKHRALVFSQFVDHLHLIRAHLDEKGYKYQYLDGSTSIKNREKAVNSFQDGEGELFLISLKAGGSGLNLTAADYVVHMDPWWNPAVEDQASDRAHRLGQQRPVTIYRLVSENTIEHKIIELHSKKRDLADSLLEGSDVSGKLSADDVMKLITT